MYSIDKSPATQMARTADVKSAAARTDFRSAIAGRLRSGLVDNPQRGGLASRLVERHQTLLALLWVGGPAPGVDAYRTPRRGETPPGTERRRLPSRLEVGYFCRSSKSFFMAPPSSRLWDQLDCRPSISWTTHSLVVAAA